MQDFIPSLLELQETDLRLLELAKEKKRLPEELETDKVAVAKEEKAKAAIEKDLHTIQLKKKEIELDIEQRIALMNKHENQLLSIKSNRDYQALTLEIKALKQKNSDQEDSILELMEQIDEQNKKVTAADEELKKVQSVLKQAEGNIKSSIDALDRDITALTAVRKEQATKLTSGILRVYEHLLQRKASIVVVAVEHDVCKGCNMTLTKQTTSTLKKTNDMVYCDYCSRLLYIESGAEEPEEEKKEEEHTTEKKA